jgi:hypothetical protein
LPKRGKVIREHKHGRDGEVPAAYVLPQPATDAATSYPAQHIPYSRFDHHRDAKSDLHGRRADEMPDDFFVQRSSQEEGNESQQLKVHNDDRQKSMVSGEPRTISARDLVEITSKGCPRRVAVVKITPGLHPVLRSPPAEDDFCAIPHEQQRSLRPSKKSDSLEKSHGMAQSNITAIFSNNGATWDHLNNLPPYSTLIGREFYLRKSHERGAWVLLIGASNKKLYERPPYFLWSIIDTVKLSALDYHDKVDYFWLVCISSGQD